MEYTDKVLICEDCKAEFIHSAEDQSRYAQRGFSHAPKRCRPCREMRKKTFGGGGGARRGGGDGGGRSGGGGSRPPRPKFDAVCSDCGQATQVPFQPSEGRPVYCHPCFLARKAGGEGAPADMD